MSRLEDEPKGLVRRRLAGVVLLATAALPLVHAAIVVPLTAVEQAEISLVMLAAALLASRVQLLRPMIIFLSCFASLRYFYWRIAWTLNLDSPVDATASVLLLAAETYGLLILFLGYFQSLEVRPRRAPAQRTAWRVDVLIPTYNESEAIVRRTVIGALAMSYPHKRVYVLDDARRPEIEAMARSLGCGYITRPDNRHAKAGNLNHALPLIDGELIAIFDADHVPVRGFLDKTVGFFEDAQVALVQTAQHFFNPDPFERNLGLTARIPPEQSFFYHVIQPGNDFWNSAFFCGSCAVLRRSALDAIGGFRTRTVTEDAHTSLELHGRGYRSVYLRLPLAAGLATETLAAHVKQRVRWARGMAQVLRVDCPLFKRGLTPAQRLNYFNAMLHFFFGIPRLIMIAAPLTFLFAGALPIKADALAVVAYILPHIGLSTIANSMIGRQYRHSFWASVYEVSIAPFTAGVTLLALVNPRLGRFNVTDKGTTLERARFDFDTSRVTLALLLVSVVALTVAFPVRLFLFGTSHGDPSELDAIVMNSLWALGNLVVLVAATCVAYEQPQQRSAPRVRRRYRCEIALGSEGRAADRRGAGALPAEARPSTDEHILGRTWDLSESGARVVLAHPGPVPRECRLSIEDESGRRVEIGARRARCDWNASGQVEAAFVFTAVDDATHRALVELIFCGDESWSAEDYPPDRLARSFWYLLTTVWRVLRPRVARTEQSPRLAGEWRAWHAGHEGRCLWLSADAALVELPTGSSGSAGPEALRVEVESGRFVEARATRAGSSREDARRVVLRLEWSDFAEMREWWTSVHDRRPTASTGFAWRRLARIR
jgi:cellulose synthase catalytic subunit (UDP-forming)